MYDERDHSWVAEEQSCHLENDYATHSFSDILINFYAYTDFIHFSGEIVHCCLNKLSVFC